MRKKLPILLFSVLCLCTSLSASLCTVTYDATEALGYSWQVQYEEGTTLRLSGPKNMPLAFSWKKDGEEYAPGSTVNVPTGTMTLTASWKPKKQPLRKKEDVQ